MLTAIESRTIPEGTVHNGRVNENLVLEYSSSSGRYYLIHAPQYLFDQMCYCLGNAYKSWCWIVARLEEVNPLSCAAIERYISMMVNKLLEPRGISSRAQRIVVSPL